MIRHFFYSLCYWGWIEWGRFLVFAIVWPLMPASVAMFLISNIFMLSSVLLTFGKHLTFGKRLPFFILTMFVFTFDVESLKQSVYLGRLVIFDNQKVVLFTVFSLLELFFGCYIVVAVAKENLLNTPTFRSQIFSVSKGCDIQSSHLIGYLCVSLNFDRSECLVCYFFALN